MSELAYEARSYDQLNTNINLLSKKHGQFKAVVQSLVEQAMAWLDEIRGRDGLQRWLELVETLRQVTEGKVWYTAWSFRMACLNDFQIFLETPRARVTLALSHYHESLANQPTSSSPSPQKSLETASELLSDLQVETYSSMERREKTEFLLEQMRLLVLVAKGKDTEDVKEGKIDLSRGEAEWIKVRVGGRKVNEGFLKEKGNEVGLRHVKILLLLIVAIQDLKLKYYELMIQYALHGSEYLDVAKYYHKVWETPSIKEDVTDKGREVSLVLAPNIFIFSC